MLSRGSSAHELQVDFAWFYVAGGSPPVKLDSSLLYSFRLIPSLEGEVVIFAQRGEANNNYASTALILTATVL